MGCGIASPYHSRNSPFSDLYLPKGANPEQNVWTMKRAVGSRLHPDTLTFCLLFYARDMGFLYSLGMQATKVFFQMLRLGGWSFNHQANQRLEVLRSFLERLRSSTAKGKQDRHQPAAAVLQPSSMLNRGGFPSPSSTVISKRILQLLTIIHSWAVSSCLRRSCPFCPLHFQEKILTLHSLSVPLFLLSFSNIFNLSPSLTMFSQSTYCFNLLIFFQT